MGVSENPRGGGHRPRNRAGTVKWRPLHLTGNGSTPDCPLLALALPARFLAMSVTPAREGTTHVECGQCRETFPDNEAVRDAYCSRECYFRSEGSGTLEHIRKDHTVCPTCFSKIKEVEKPPEGTSLVIGPVDHDADGANHHAKDVLIGFQSRTQHADHVETNIREALFSISETVVVSLGCKCGTPSGYEPDETIERVEGSRVVLNLLRELRQRYAQGELDTQPSKDQLFDALREQGRDWEYAVGRALHA